VVGVFTEADVGDDEQVGRGVFGGLDGLLDDAAFAVRIAADGVFFGGNAEEDDAAETEPGGFAGFFGDKIDGKLGVAGHRADRLADGLSGAGEEGQNQAGRIEAGFANEAADGGIVAQAAESGGGEMRVGHRYRYNSANQGRE
jgi:hypothetical protein